MTVFLTLSLREGWLYQKFLSPRRDGEGSDPCQDLFVGYDIGHMLFLSIRY